MKTVIYSGYTYSGGILAGLILRELESIVVPANMEFRLMKERHGICDLEEAIFNIRDPEIIDLAFKDFNWLTANFAMPNSFLEEQALVMIIKQIINSLKKQVNILNL